MFTNKLYWQVNREERFYCALLFHCFLSYSDFRIKYCDFIKNRFNVHLNPDNLDVYFEVAALRDYWRDLGDPITYSPDTHNKRKAIILSILKLKGLDENVINKFDLFWTSKDHLKLWSPGRWSKSALIENNLKDLISIKWAFNAKPDMLLVSNNAALMIEAKVESSEGIYDDENTASNQFETQDLIIKLLNNLVPSFNKVTIVRKVLSPEVNSDFTWKDIWSILKDIQIDDFTRKCFNNLIQR